MFSIVYHIGISVLLFFVRIAALFHNKINHTLKGQKNTLQLLPQLPPPKGRRYWIHCASLGEFEMAVPLINELQKNKSHEIYISFFSSSGYEKRKHYPCNGVFYLPADKLGNVKKWYRYLNPDVCIFVKYDFWYNYLKTGLELKKEMFVINGRFTSEHFIFKRFGNAWKKLLQRFNAIYVTDNNSFEILKQQHFSNVKLSGDTRYDRVWETVNALGEFPEINDFKKEKYVLILGSSWPAEEDLLYAFLNKHSKDFFNKWKVIIAPHDVSKPHIENIEEKFKAFHLQKYSKGNFEDCTILLIDNVGMLSRLYRYANIALIGGAFGKGLHNILEACCFGMPVFFGPHTHKFPEAKETLNLGFGNPVNNYAEFETALLLHLHSQPILSAAGNAAKKMVQGHLGATEMIVKEINN